MLAVRSVIVLVGFSVKSHGSSGINGSSGIEIDKFVDEKNSCIVVDSVASDSESMSCSV